MPRPRRVRALLKGAGDTDPWVRSASIGALAQLEAKEAGDLVLAAASDEDPAVRRAALEAIASIKPEGGARVAAAALSDPTRQVRVAAGIALAELRTPEPAAGPGLVRLLAECSSNSWMREIFEGAGFPGLAAFLRGEKRRGDPPWLVRLCPSARTPEEIAALEALVAEVEDKDHGEKLVVALRGTLAPGQDDILLKNLAEGNAALRRAAAILLGHLAQDREPCAAAIEKALHDEDAGVREAAAAAIERLRAGAK